MPVISILFGGLLIALGVWGYTASDLEGPAKLTALIPVPVGAIIALCGLVALKESLLKHAMHAAAVVGLVGFLLAAGRLIQAGIEKGINISDLATVELMGMALLCLVFVGFCVNSFIQARRRRAASQP